MTISEFRESAAPPAGDPPLEALWHDLHEDWAKAHHVVQDETSAEAAWVHAYLHRKEGDISNAHYWYERAGKPAYTGSLESEWTGIASVLLARQ